MRLRERLTPENRLKTGWIVPSSALSAVQTYAPGPGMLVAGPDRLLFAGLLAGGLLLGVFWQCYSPRPLGERLVLPALLTAIAAVLLALPMGGEPAVRPSQLLCGVGIVSGLVLTDFWQSARGCPGENSRSPERSSRS